MKFELLTLTGTKYNGEAREVHVLTASGEIGVLPHHEDLTTIVLPGPVTITTDKGVEHLACFGGMLQVAGDTVRLLADEAEHSDELIHEEIEAAMRHAQELLANSKSKHELHHAQTLVDRQSVRLQVAGMRRRKRRG